MASGRLAAGKQRQAMAYHYIAGLALAEIAGILGGTSNTARRRGRAGSHRGSRVCARRERKTTMTLSPRLLAGLVYDAAEPEPPDAEMNRMTELAQRRGARRVAVGHGRSAVAARAVADFTRRWEARGGIVLDVVTWPEEAASWLRQATRFAAADPDLWVMAGAPRGWAQMTRRLLWSTPWQPGRTLAFAALGTQRAIELVGAHNLPGLAGATADGGTWTVCNGNIHTTLPSRDTAK